MQIIIYYRILSTNTKKNKFLDKSLPGPGTYNIKEKSTQKGKWSFGKYRFEETPYKKFHYQVFNFMDLSLKFDTQHATLKNVWSI